MIEEAVLFRERIRAELSRRGVGVSAIALVSGFERVSRGSSEALPPSLVASLGRIAIAGAGANRRAAVLGLPIRAAAVLFASIAAVAAGAHWLADAVAASSAFGASRT